MKIFVLRCCPRGGGVISIPTEYITCTKINISNYIRISQIRAAKQYPKLYPKLTISQIGAALRLLTLIPRPSLPVPHLPTAACHRCRARRNCIGLTGLEKHVPSRPAGAVGRRLMRPRPGKHRPGPARRR